MKTVSDGLDCPSLIELIVEELVREFPRLHPERITRTVHERRTRIARPATGGTLFLEAKKLLQLEDDEVITSYPSPGGRTHEELEHSIQHGTF